ncbi:coiled-coil domain-containing protein 146 isoform X2 [Cottoperca gobio]|uniref:Coiled-coil domain-containing protein 146 isoform X2 n=1 Tax=Cottoperca gobio TaxID=56716 RepID=A0A6J2S735_COTGO|nr:coiled-coil domain-containing protein 146 isoform X2 [Cottoperca gobio]
MSQSEEQQDSRNTNRGEVKVEEQEEEEKGIENTPLVARAPDASLPEEPPFASADVTASPAFRCLDELSLDKISKTKVAKLKSSFRLLHDTLKSTQDSEIHLLGEAKRCRAELERLHAQVERTEEQSTSEEPESEVNELRQQFLQACNELKAAEDREYKTQYKLKCLWEEKQCLEKENEIQPKPAELESRAKALQDKHEDLRREVSLRQLEVRSLTEDVETHETQILKEQKELEDKAKIIELKEAEKAQLISIPDQVLKEIGRKHSKRESAMKTMEALNAEISEMEQHVKEVNERSHVLRWENKESKKGLEGVGAHVDACQRECRQLLKEQEVNREEKAELMGNRGILEMKLQNIMCDRKHLCECHAVQLKEKNRQMQTFRRMEHALMVATEQLEDTQSIYNELQAQLDAVPKQEASIQQRMELQKEVDALKVSFEKQLSVSEEQRQKMQQCGMIQGLLRESNCLREELHNLKCLTQIKVEERGQKHRELLRAELNRHIQQELREKDLIIMDHNKLNAMLQRRVLQNCKLCNMITEEKNKYVKLKQIASQTTTEMTEQVKVLENETEIQRTIVINKDRSLTKARMKSSKNSKIRDKLNNDISKAVWKHRQIIQEYEDNKLELMKLTQTINLQEQALLEVNTNHETAIQRRNLLGIQLLEHEEVLFNFFEKVNIQEAAITKGNMTLETLEKEMRDLQLEINEEKRQIDLKKKKEMPLEIKLEGEITTLLIELSEARDKTLEGLNRTVDYKELKGEDPSTAELVKDIEQLELNLAKQERQSLEKELLVDQVTRLSKPLSEQAENCQQDRLSLAKKLNEIRTHVIDSNHRMMAVAAELSMKQAAALSLQQEIKEKEFQMDRCQRQLEQGLPPCPEIEKEWRRMLRDKKRRRRDKEERERLAEEEEWTQLPNGEYTTAESRPNAYVPQTDSLPLPKPYGAHAPFKPSQPGANMRHIRKPTLKPLEI